MVSHLHNHPTENASEKIIFVTIMRKNKLDVFVYWSKNPISQVDKHPVQLN